MTSSLVLGLDTCGHACSLALVDQQGDIVFNQSRWIARGHSAALPALGAEAFTAHDPAQVVALVVTHGPGGFTGMRVGLAYARAFAFAQDLPAYALSVETALRFSVGDKIAIAIDSRRGDVFMDGQIMRKEALSSLKVPIAGSWNLSQETPKIGWHEPCPVLMARHGLKLWTAGTPPDKVLEPLYIRAPSIG